MSDRQDGTYQGSIVHAYVTEDGFNKGEFLLKLDINLDGGGAVTCKQQLSDSEEKKRGQVMTALGLTWPFKFADLKALAGKTIDVNLKTSAKGNQNAYVATIREERVLTEDEVNAIFDKSDIPF